MPEFSYQEGRFFRDGEPFFLIGVEYQYYRDRRENWEPRLRQLKDAQANTIAFYVPWRHHQIEAGPPGSFDFQGETRDNRDLVGFLRLCEELELYMLAKPGPFVHSELNVGGLPNSASPSWNESLEPVRQHTGQPLLWGYDQSQLPADLDPLYDEAVRHWLQSVGQALAPHAAPQGRLIAVQLNDETLYCTSNAPPWELGYDGPSLIRYRELLQARYPTIEHYNRLHETSWESFAQVTGPRLGGEPGSVLEYVDWGELQWLLRRESYARYRSYLGLSLPALTNFAGITPPIEENVPEGSGQPPAPQPPELARLYPDWWLAHNRVDRDRDVYHYGMISWLGVAAYDIADPRTTSYDPELTRSEVFQRYINTAGRRRGINVEENWGFARLYHPFSRHPLVPFFQTLASVAGGCTGYVVFCGVQHDYWEDDLDRVTRQVTPTFPSDAPLTSQGEITPLYETLCLLNGWFAREGSDYLLAEQERQLCWLVYPPYAAVSSWFPGEQLGSHQTPRSGVDGLESFAATVQEAGYTSGVAELDAVPLTELADWPLCALRLGFFMEAAAQEKLLAYVRGGGTLLCCGELPQLDLELSPCGLLAKQVSGRLTRLGQGRLYHSAENVFAQGPVLLEVLAELGFQPLLRTSPGLRAFLYRHQEHSYLWFFQFLSREAPAWIEFASQRLELELGSKTCGVVHVVGDRLRSVLFKGKNEVEGVQSKVVVRLGDHELRQRGDLLWFGGAEPAAS